ncbi:MAG: FtsX-like permease family protein [Bryobacteraceae bacterium]
MFWRYIASALRFRRRRLLVAFCALAVAATLATVLFSVYSDIERKMRHEFRGYGANLIVAPADGATTVPLEGVAEAERLGLVSAPFLYTPGRVNGENVVLAGVDFQRSGPLTSYWRVAGERIADDGECLAGVRAAAHLRLEPGSRVEVEGSPCVVRGIVTSGGPEDSQILLPLRRLAESRGIQGAASVIQARGDGQRLEELRDDLARALPETEVRLLRAVAETEAAVALKVKRTLFLLAALILGITVLCVANNFTALVLERKREIGLLKAIGAGERRIAALFVCEALMLALASALAGYGVGLGAAWWIGRSVFGPVGAVGVDFQALFPVALTTLAMAAIATSLPLARIWKIEAAAVLRGE